MKDKKPKDFADFIKEKIAELGIPDEFNDNGIFEAVREAYPDVSTREIMQSIMILSGGDVITVDENGNRIKHIPPKSARSLI